MINDLLFTINALLPIILLILLGYFLKRIHFFNEGFLKIGNKICFKVFLPALLFYNIYNIKSINNIDWTFVLFVVVAIISIFLLSIIVTIFFKDPKQKGVIHQGIFRSNYAFIGIPLATMLSGEGSEAVAIASVISAFSIPLFNVFAVLALSVYDHDEEGRRVSYKSIVLKIAKNPLIIAVLIGLLVLLIRLLLTSNNINFNLKADVPFLYKTIGNVANVASPLALIVLGGGFTFAAVGKLKRQITVGVIARLILVPVLSLTIAYALGFRENHFPTLVALFATPVAVSTVPMSAEMDQDATLAGQLVVWSSLVSAITLFIIIMICKTMNVF